MSELGLFCSIYEEFILVMGSVTWLQFTSALMLSALMKKKLSVSGAGSSSYFSISNIVKCHYFLYHLLMNVFWIVFTGDQMKPVAIAINWICQRSNITEFGCMFVCPPFQNLGWLWVVIFNLPCENLFRNACYSGELTVL